MPKWATSAATPNIRATERSALAALDVSLTLGLHGLGHPLILLPDAEALQVIFDPEKVSFRQLVEFFYRMHDPTTLNRQGPDTGTQYRSAIFFHDEEQEKIAKDITEKVQKEWWKNGKISTEVVPAGEWWDAETYHQLYVLLVHLYRTGLLTIMQLFRQESGRLRMSEPVRCCRDMLLKVPYVY